MGQLEPGTGEGVGELLRVLVETARDLLVGRVHAQRQVGRRHHRRMLLRRIVCVRNHMFRLAILRHPLMGTCRALGQLPFVAEQHVEVAVVPSGGMRFPGALNATGRGVHALAGAEPVDPAQALRFDRGCFGLGADQLGVSCAVGFAEGMAAGHQCHGLFVVHGHAREGFAHVTARGHRIRVAVRTFRVHVDQAHLHRGQRIRELTVAGVTAVGLVTGGEPGFLHAPVDVLFRFPDVRTPSSETESLEPHRFQRDVAGEDHQVGPRDLAAVLLLDRPQQAARLVEVAVIRPAVEGSKTLVACPGAASTVRDAIRAGAVPRQADHQAAVVTPVSRPPLLRIRHQGMEILDHRIQVEALELLGIVERLAHRVRLGRVLMQDVQPQLIGPPGGVRPGTAPHRGVDCGARERARHFVWHGSLRGSSALD